MTKTKAPASENGVVTNRFNLSLNGTQMNVIHQFCTQAQLPSVELKREVAALQEQIESLVPES